MKKTIAGNPVLGSKKVCGRTIIQVRCKCGQGFWLGLIPHAYCPDCSSVNGTKGNPGTIAPLGRAERQYHGNHYAV
jgi:hypothetical protein